MKKQSCFSKNYYRAMLVTIALLSSGITANAQQFLPTFSGASVIVTDYNDNTPSSNVGWTEGTSRYTLRAVASFNTLQPIARVNTNIKFNGTQSATLKWTPSGTGLSPAPPLIRISKWVRLTWITLSDTGTNPAISGSFGTDSSVNYSISSTLGGAEEEFSEIRPYDGQPFNVDLTPHLDINASANTSYSGEIQASMSVSAGASAVSLSAQGCNYTNGEYRCLVGQPVRISATGAIFSPDGCSYEITGGKPFKSYNPQQAKAEVTKFAPDDYKKGSIDVVFADEGEVSVIFHGQYDAGRGKWKPIDIPLKIRVIKPTVAFVMTINPLVDIGNTGFSSSAIKTNPTIDGKACAWSGKVTIPQEFQVPTADQNKIGWSFVQLIDRNRFKVSKNATPVNGQLPELPIGMQGKGLDETYPYLPYTRFGYIPFSADGRAYEAGDTPSEPLSDDYQQIRIQEPFETYIMFYAPPGKNPFSGFTGSPVPLKQINWHWQGQASYVKDQQTNIYSWKMSNIPNPILQKDEEIEHPEHPTWNRIITALPNNP